MTVLLAAAHPLVHLNAGLNLLATLLLVIGLLLIKRGRERAHGRVMLAAFFVSCLFLISYLTYHQIEGHVSFTHPGVVRYLYWAILGSHIPLAMTVPFLAALTIYFGLKATGWRADATSPTDDLARFRQKHRRLARWTFPIWLYVSVTGVAVYAMLYHLWPPTG